MICPVMNAASSEARNAATPETSAGICTRLMFWILRRVPQMQLAPVHLVDSNLLPVAGGVPIVTADGEVIGAIGVGEADDVTDDRIAHQDRDSVAAIVA
jgi:uncharacterized protein GlcG (DUF336 family)